MQNSWTEAPLRYSWSRVANCWISWDDSLVRSYKVKTRKITMRSKYNIKTRPNNENVKSTYCGHVVLQQLCSSGAELSFTCSLCLRGCWGGSRWRVSFCIHRGLERTSRGIYPLWVTGKCSRGVSKSFLNTVVKMGTVLTKYWLPLQKPPSRLLCLKSHLQKNKPYKLQVVSNWSSETWVASEEGKTPKTSTECYRIIHKIKI